MVFILLIWKDHFFRAQSKETFINDFMITHIYAAVAKGYSDALVRRRSRVQFPSAAPLQSY